MRYLITGASRGIGLGLTQQLAARGDEIIATCRTPATAEGLNAIQGKVSVFQMDVGSDESVQAAAEAISTRFESIDVLINNAGINPSEGRIGSITSDNMNHVMNTNVVGMVRVTQAFLPLLQNGTDAKLVNLSSQLGSLTLVGARMMGGYSYNISKAAVNMFTRMLSHELPNTTVIAIHPGWVQTDMGGPNAAVTQEDSVAGILARVDSLTPAETNTFWNYAGEPMPW